MHIHHRIARAVAAALLLTGAGNAHAQFDYTLTVGVEHNDNVRLSADDPDSQTILRPSLGFSFDRTGSVLQADVTGIIDYRNYLSDDYSDQVRGHLLGTVNWIMIPHRLTWTFADALTVQPIRELEPDAPTNRQQTNVFATGPTLLFDLGRATRGQAELRYTDSYAEETGRFNSQRIGAALRGIRELSATSTISGNLQAQRVEFDNTTVVLPPITVTPDYDRYDAYVGYTRTLAAFDLDLSAGYSTLNFDDAADDDGGPLFRANLGWRPSARSTLSLGLAYQYTDAASSMLDAGVIGVPPTDITTGDATVSSEPFRERRVDLGYAYQGNRFGFSVTPYYRELKYVNNAELDRESTGLRASLSWALRPRLDLTVYADGENLDYQTIDTRIEHRSYGTTLGYQMTQRLSWNLSLRHVERDSSPLGSNAEQNIAYLWLAFSR